MDLYHLSLMMTMIIMLMVERVASKLNGPSIYEKYKITWGYDHVWSSSNGRDVHLSLDQSSGSAFESKSSYGSGFFHLNMKLPGRNSAGVVTAFYMTSQTENERDELDFEFLGNKEGKPYILQTNVIASGKGDREQRIHLWFDPTSSYHSYRLLWNSHQIAFFVDNSPIRVFKNKQNIGVGYPSKPMYIVASIWNGDSWATDGGKTKINWTYAPFVAGFRSFTIYGCPSHSSNMEVCYSSNLWWNRKQFWQLTSEQEKEYQKVKRNYMIYDYCSDSHRFAAPPPECPQ